MNSADVYDNVNHSLKHFMDWLEQCRRIGEWLPRPEYRDRYSQCLDRAVMQARGGHRYWTCHWQSARHSCVMKSGTNIDKLCCADYVKIDVLPNSYSFPSCSEICPLTVKFFSYAIFFPKYILLIMLSLISVHLLSVFWTFCTYSLSKCVVYYQVAIIKYSITGFGASVFNVKVL